MMMIEVPIIFGVTIELVVDWCRFELIYKGSIVEIVDNSIDDLWIACSS